MNKCYRELLSRSAARHKELVTCEICIAVAKFKGKQQRHRSCDYTQALKNLTEQRPSFQIKTHKSSPEIRVKAPESVNDMQQWRVILVVISLQHN